MWRTLLLWLALCLPCQAHLMVAQHGTLNLAHGGAYMVLSLPVSAFQGLSLKTPGRITLPELKAEHGAIEAQLQRGAQLLGYGKPLPLQGVMLSFSANEGSDSTDQLVALGRYALPPRETPLIFRVGLYGAAPAERRYEITVTRPGDSELLVLTPSSDSRLLWRSAWAVMGDYFTLGVNHILTGFDHMLFLLVVLSAGWRWRAVLLALSAFTVGHAITLAACVWGGLAAPPAIVEPAIAATIVGMALLDWRARMRGAAMPTGLRIGLVFGFALIHGLGFAGALAELGLDPGHRLPAVAGFNLGIEAGQLLVAALYGLALWLARRVDEGHGLRLARLANWTGIAAGSFWLASRLLGVG